MLKAESEFQERELIKMEREREMAILRRQHEREIYMLKRKLHENSKMQVPGSSSISGRGDGSSNASDPDSLLQVMKLYRVESVNQIQFFSKYS